MTLYTCNISQFAKPLFNPLRKYDGMTSVSTLKLEQPSLILLFTTFLSNCDVSEYLLWKLSSCVLEIVFQFNHEYKEGGMYDLPETGQMRERPGWTSHVTFVRDESWQQVWPQWNRYWDLTWLQQCELFPLQLSWDSYFSTLCRQFQLSDGCCESLCNRGVLESCNQWSTGKQIQGGCLFNNTPLKCAHTMICKTKLRMYISFTSVSYDVVWCYEFICTN